MRNLQLLVIAVVASLYTVASHAQAIERELVISAKIPRSGDFLAYGLESIWMMSGSKLARVNPADNSVADIPVKGSMGRLRAFQIGDSAVWLPDVAADTLFRIAP